MYHIQKTLLTERIILISLTLVAFATRFYRLSHPDAVVFDELHFGNFLERHLRNEFSFDIHPWLGKLTLAIISSAASYRATGFSYSVGTHYPNEDYLIPRAISAMFGTFCIPLMFLLCRELNLSISCSLLVACLCLFDNLLLVESRLILLESQLVCYLILTLLLAARVWRLSETSPRSYAYYFALIGAALAGAAATSVKWSGAITPTLIALTCILGLGVQTWPMAMQDCGLACVVGTIAYLIPWYIHLEMSTKYTAAADVMSTTFKRRLIGNMTTERFNHASFFVQAVVELHLRQMKANAAVKTRHVWESKWWQWPLNQGGMLYYMDKKTLRAIYLTQNAAGAMWITITVMIYVIIATTACRYKLGKVGNRMRDVVKKGGFFMCGFVFNLVPFVLVQRCYFLYHYLPALMHAQLLLGVMVDALPNRLGVVVSVVVILSVMISFFLSAPLIYCTPMTVRHLLRQPWISTGGK